MEHEKAHNQNKESITDIKEIYRRIKEQYDTVRLIRGVEHNIPALTKISQEMAIHTNPEKHIAQTLRAIIRADKDFYAVIEMGTTKYAEDEFTSVVVEGTAVVHLSPNYEKQLMGFVDVPELYSETKEPFKPTKPLIVCKVSEEHIITQKELFLVRLNSADGLSITDLGSSKDGVYISTYKKEGFENLGESVLEKNIDLWLPPDELMDVALLNTPDAQRIYL